jgi:arylsulfatase A-like enzyme
MNVVVVAAHGLNCHWLGPYGNEWVSTPAFDSLACEAVAFDRHFADDPSPAGFGDSCPPAVRRALRTAGVTVAFLDDLKGRPKDDGEWDQMTRPEPAAHPSPADAFLTAIESALDRLSAAGRWLLWVETDRLVPPWDFEFETYQQYAAATSRFAFDEESDDPAELPAPTDEPTPGAIAADDDVLWHRLRNSFAAAVTSFDAEMDALIDVLRERGLDDSAAWIITSGYGWPLGEHGVVGADGSRLHEELVHLPLLIRLPEHRQGMRRVPAFTRTADLGPTLLELFGVPVPPGVPATSVLPLTAGPGAVLRDAARSAHGDERRIQTDEWAYLSRAADRPERLYRKPDDLWEVNDVAPRHPDECARLAELWDDSPKEGASR